MSPFPRTISYFSWTTMRWSSSAQGLLPVMFGARKEWVQA